jgi:hypothetical protein
LPVRLRAALVAPTVLVHCPVDTLLVEVAAHLTSRFELPRQIAPGWSATLPLPDYGRVARHLFTIGRSVGGDYNAPQLHFVRNVGGRRARNSWQRRRAAVPSKFLLDKDWSPSLGLGKFHAVPPPLVQIATLSTA